MLRGPAAASGNPPAVPNQITQVSLVHASDSVRSVANATPTNNLKQFAPPPKTAKVMSKPPVRVVAPPTRLPQPASTSFAPMTSHGAYPVHQHHHHQHQQQSYQYGQPHTFSSKQGGPSMVVLPTMSVPPMAGRSYNELTEYAEQQRKQIEANRREEERRQMARSQTGQAAALRVQSMKREVAEEEGELRRLSELERETRSLRVRNSEKSDELSSLSSSLQQQQRELRTAASRVEILRKQLEELYRRRQAASAAALVEQRRMQQENQQQQQMNRSHERVPSGSERPRASVEPFQVVLPRQDSDAQGTHKNTVEQDAIDGKFAHSPPSEPAALAPGASAGQVTPITPSATTTSAPTTRQDTSPSPPKDPHPTVTPVVVASPAPPVPEKPQRSRDPHQLYNNSLLLESQKLSVERPSCLAESMDESRLRTGKDAVSLRSDSLKATKRRSWAASEGISMCEAETIRRVLEEQRRGRTHFIPEVPAEAEEAAEKPEAESSDEVIPGDMASGDATSTKKVCDVEETQTTREEELDERATPITSDEEVPETAGSCHMEMEMNRRQVKGILRPPGLRKPHRRIEFDPLALMLDAALEGELELVKTSAAKLSDVSSANDEGITALHNAICAGHYEIVKFLIESDADVNAQDSDGWTPLHCAASCNNLPMVRQLVEGGACVLASTLSDMETPVEKCEEDEEGYDRCLRYLSAAHSETGKLHGGKVYAAYDYDAEYEDELSFKAGDELRVISKDDKEKHWWTCEKVTVNGDAETKETGLVPRTYVSLYPALRHRQRLNFLMFDVPMESNNNEKD